MLSLDQLNQNGSLKEFTIEEQTQKQEKSDLMDTVNTHRLSWFTGQASRALTAWLSLNKK